MIEFQPNAAGGRDFVFGYIHGRFDTVDAALAELVHDPQRDRLFSLGDLIDYGPRSADALWWMRIPFTGTVRGNHEESMREFLVLGARLNNDGGAWRQHWASGWIPLRGGRERQGIPGQLAAWRAARETLPFALTIHLPGVGRVGLLHAQGATPPERRHRLGRALCAQLEHDRHAAWSARCGHDSRCADPPRRIRCSRPASPAWTTSAMAITRRPRPAGPHSECCALTPMCTGRSSGN